MVQGYENQIKMIILGVKKHVFLNQMVFERSKGNKNELCGVLFQSWLEKYLEFHVAYGE